MQKDGSPAVKEMRLKKHLFVESLNMKSALQRCDAKKKLFLGLSRKLPSIPQLFFERENVSFGRHAMHIHVKVG